MPGDAIRCAWSGSFRSRARTQILYHRRISVHTSTDKNNNHEKQLLNNNTVDHHASDSGRRYLPDMTCVTMSMSGLTEQSRQTDHTPTNESSEFYEDMLYHRHSD